VKTVKEEDIEKKGQNENEGDIEESQVSMVIDEDVDSDSQYEMENEKDLIESDLKEDIVFGKLFDFSRD
jgi:exosome complex RNA-binding protein Csl4